MAKKPGGHLLELEVKKILKSYGWEVLSQEPYLDPIEGKPRSIDILAIQKKVISNNNGSPFGMKRDVNFEMKLFIECKFIPETNVPAVLYYENKKKESMEKAFKGIRFYRKIYDEYVARELIAEHDYSKSNTIIVQCSDNNEDGYGLKAIQQSCHGILSGAHTSRADYSIDYPVVIGDSSAKIKIADSDDYKTESDYTLGLLYEYKYINPTNKQNEVFFVDMLTRDSLDNFLITKKAELDKAISVIRTIEINKQWHDDSGERRYSGNHW